MCFFDIKCENVDEKICIKMFLFGVVIFDIIFEFVKNNEDMYFFLLYDVECVYGVVFIEIFVMEKYCEMVEDVCIVKKKIKVCDFFQVIVEIQFESGYFYIMFEDMVNCVNLIVGCILMSNFCLEILQVSELSKFNEDLFYVQMGKDIFCNFGFLNIVVVMDSVDFVKMIEMLIRVLMVVFEMSNIMLVLFVVKGNDDSYVIGFGQMNLYGYLVCECIFYGLEEGIDFINIYFYMVIYNVLKVFNCFVVEKG